MRAFCRLLGTAVVVATLSACTPISAPASPPTTATLPTLPPSPAATHTPQPSLTPTLKPVDTVAPAATPTIVTAADLDVSGEVALELVAQTGGAVRSVAVEGDVAYVGVGPRLVAFDASALPELQLIGQSDLLPGSVRAVVVQDGMAYVGADHHVVALDVSDPAAMAVVDELELPGPASDLALGDGTLYVAGVAAVDSPAPVSEFGELQFTSHVTALDSRSLTLLSSQTIPVRIDQIVWANGAVYAAGSGWGGEPSANLWALEARTSGELDEPIRIWQGLDDVRSLAAYADVILVGHYYKVTALDISQLQQPKLLWESEEFEHGIVAGIAAQHGLLYTSGYQAAGAYVPAYSALEPPRQLPTEQAAPASTQSAVAGEYLLAAGGGFLEVYPLASLIPGWEWPDPMPERVARYQSLTWADSAVVSNDILVVADISSGYRGSSTIELQTFRLPGLDLLGSLADLEAQQARIAAEGSRAYLTSGRGDLYTVNLANPEAPALLNVQPAGTPFDWSVQPIVADGRLYARETHERVIAVDLLAAEAPRVAARYYTPQEARTLALGAGYLFYNDDAQLHVLEAASLEEVGSLSVPGIRHIAADGDLVAAASILDGLVLVSASDATNPEVVGRLEFRGAYKVALSGDLAFVIAQPNNYDDENARLLIADISDPAAPRAVGLLESPPLFGYDPTVTTWGEYVIIHNSDAGIYVYRITEWTDGSASSPPPSNWPIRHVFEAGPSANVGDVQLSADGSRVLLQEGNRVVVLDGETETTLNVGQDGHVEGSPGGGIALSADGSTAAFWSSATDLTGDDVSADCPADSEQECGSLFFYDMLTGTISRTAVGEPMGGVSRIYPSVALSADGRYAVFTASGNLHSGTLLLDRVTGTISQISPAALAADISADGRVVAFIEDGEMYVFDRQDGDVEWISQPVSDPEDEGESSVQPGHEGGSAHVDLSANGRYVVFQSGAPRLVERDVPSCINYTGDELPACWHVYLFDREAGTMEMISVSDEDEPGDAISGGGYVSADGRYVLFHSFAGNLTPEGPITCQHYAQGNCPEVYVRDREVGHTVLISRGWGVQLPDGPSWSRAITPDGRYGAITSSAGNIAPGSEGRQGLAGNALLVDLPALLERVENGSN